MLMNVAGQWVEKPQKIEDINPYDGSVIDAVPRADLGDVERALESAVRGAGVMAKLSGYERYIILKKTAERLEERTDDFAETITMEEGKPLAESRFEVSRAAQALMLSAEEAKRIHGETIPFDGAPGGERKMGFTLRVPCGVVVAISPFNAPLNLTAHKVGPAIAAGNSVVIKPASDTPLCILKLTELLLDCGLSPEGIQCLTGVGGEIGDALCRDRRVRKISFTGSRDVGERICRIAGIKKVTMELGSNCPAIVMPDADLEKVATALAATGYTNAGQVCVSTQRVLATEPVYDDLLDALKPKVAALKTGNPLKEGIKIGPLVREREALRVESWINEALEGGARLVVGGKRDRAIYAPTIVADVKPEMRISREELFGPALAVTRVKNLDEAIALANDTPYGLAAAIFTEGLESAMKFARECHAGNLHINWGTQWRVELMPYGGLKESGFGKEGPRYAVEEMSELKLVCFHLRG